MYARKISGTTLTFGVSGKLYRNALVMYDKETDSLWSHVLGLAVTGQMKGKTLTPVPATQTTWSEWKKMHPHTIVLSKRFSPYGAGSGYKHDPYKEYYQSKRTGIRPVYKESSRLPAKEKVLGVRVRVKSKAYAFSFLKEHHFFEDQLGREPILIVFNPESSRGTVFHRKVQGQLLSFQLEPDGYYLRDKETKSIWDQGTGVAIAGPLKGASLTQIPSHYAFWFGWYEYFPDTEIGH